MPQRDSECLPKPKGCRRVWEGIPNSVEEARKMHPKLAILVPRLLVMLERGSCVEKSGGDLVEIRSYSLSILPVTMSEIALEASNILGEVQK